MYDLPLHFLLAQVTLLLLVVTTLTGILLLKPTKRWYKPLKIIHILGGLLTLLFFLLTYFLAPKI